MEPLREREKQVEKINRSVFVRINSLLFLSFRMFEMASIEYIKRRIRMQMFI